jgi:hypothetical protein
MWAIEMQKQCTKCKETKQLSLFNKNKNTKDGLNYWCTSCRTDHQRKTRTKEYATQYAREWRKKNKEKFINNLKKYRESQHGKQIRRSLQAKRKAVQKQRVPAWADSKEISLWYEVASVLSNSGVVFHVDHIVPMQGSIVSGFHVENNLQVLPAYLNISKNNSWNWETQNHG